ncbi:MAG: hypothetical protein ABIS47_12635 [Acidimicrobiales bacterium]
MEDEVVDAELQQRIQTLVDEEHRLEGEHQGERPAATVEGYQQ